MERIWGIIDKTTKEVCVSARMRNVLQQAKEWRAAKHEVKCFPSWVAQAMFNA